MIFYHNKEESAKSKILEFFPFGRILKQNLYFYFNSIGYEQKNQTERLFCLSDNVAVCDMAQFFCFKKKKLKIEN